MDLDLDLGDLKKLLGIEDAPAASGDGAVAVTEALLAAPPKEDLVFGPGMTCPLSRPDSYKARAAQGYRKTVEQVRVLFRKIDSSQPVTASEVKRTLQGFLDLLKADRNILLALPGLSTPEPDYLYPHAVNAAIFSMALASSAGYDQTKTYEIGEAALLMDVGMQRVPEGIRFKNGPLTPREMFEVTKHPLLLAEMLQRISGLAPTTMMAGYQHHERPSGEGYPRKKTGNTIHAYARLLAVADTYASLTAARPWRKKMIPYVAVKTLLQMSGAKRLDGELVRRFLDTVSLFPVGSLVKLGSGRVGKVIHANPGNYTKPVVIVLKDAQGGVQGAGRILDMQGADDTIAEALDAGAIAHDAMDGF